MEKNDAAEQFYHTYYRLIYRTAKRLCRTQEEQEELIQDSLLRFLKNLAYYTERNSDETSALIVLTIANCYARCVAEKGVTIKIVGTLQQYTNGSWVYVTSWTETGATVVILDKTHPVASGYKYRFIARFYIYDSNGSFVESDILSRIYDYNS